MERRIFIKLAALSGAGVAATSLAGCSVVLDLARGSRAEKKVQALLDRDPGVESGTATYKNVEFHETFRVEATLREMDEAATAKCLQRINGAAFDLEVSTGVDVTQGQRQWRWFERLPDEYLEAAVPLAVSAETDLKAWAHNEGVSTSGPYHVEGGSQPAKVLVSPTYEKGNPTKLAKMTTQNAARCQLEFTGIEVSWAQVANNRWLEQLGDGGFVIEPSFEANNLQMAFPSGQWRELHRQLANLVVSADPEHSGFEVAKLSVEQGEGAEIRELYTVVQLPDGTDPVDEAVLSKLVHLFAAIRSEVVAAASKAGVSGAIPADFSLRRKEGEGIDALVYYAFDITEDGRVQPSKYLPHNELAETLHKLLQQEIEGDNS